eukprot:4367143-Amphidinium_carterae.1
MVIASRLGASYPFQAAWVATSEAYPAQANEGLYEGLANIEAEKKDPLGGHPMSARLFMTRLSFWVQDYVA